jgi:hypothetical protein
MVILRVGPWTRITSTPWEPEEHANKGSAPHLPNQKHCMLSSPVDDSTTFQWESFALEHREGQTDLK